MPILEVKNLTKRFGGILALQNLSLEVNENEVLGLIGPNGAGKTTLVDTIMGHYQPDSGKIYFKNKMITGLKPHQISKRGIGRTFQVIRLFKRMSLIENMFVAGKLHKREEIEEKTSQLLEFVGLLGLKHEKARNLSYGQQKLLELAILLMQDPELLILDEPVSGVHPKIRDRLHDHILKLKDEGKTFIIIEHNMPFVMSTSERVIVLNEGAKIAEGSPKTIRTDEKVIEAYLGEAI